MYFMNYNHKLEDQAIKSVNQDFIKTTKIVSFVEIFVKFAKQLKLAKYALKVIL